MFQYTKTLSILNVSAFSGLNRMFPETFFHIDQFKEENDEKSVSNDQAAGCKEKVADESTSVNSTAEKTEDEDEEVEYGRENHHQNVRENYRQDVNKLNHKNLIKEIHQNMSEKAVENVIEFNNITVHNYFNKSIIVYYSSSTQMKRIFLNDTVLTSGLVHPNLGKLYVESILFSNLERKTFTCMFKEKSSQEGENWWISNGKDQFKVDLHAWLGDYFEKPVLIFLKIVRENELK